MLRYLSSEDKVLLNTQRLGLFLRDFSRYGIKEKELCVRRIEDKYVEELEEFIEFYMKYVKPM